MPEVVTCFLTYENTVLILKRSNKVKTFKGYWAGISGYVEKDEKPITTAMKEIIEETGLQPNEFQLLNMGKTITIKSVDNDEQCSWKIHPFLFETTTQQISIDWEHTEYRWIKPDWICGYKTVPKLKEALDLVTQF